LRREKFENKIPGESRFAWPQKTASNPLPIGSNLAVIDPHLGDRDALDAAIELVRKHNGRWREFQALVLERGWEAAAMIASYDAQTRALRLPPWEAPPCVASVRGKDRAARLLRRMLRRGVSRWHPRPLEAIAEASTGSDTAMSRP
jgi:hypothetical protein